MSWFDSLKDSAGDFFTGATDSVLGGAKDWLDGNVSQWAQQGNEVPSRPETVRPEDSPPPSNGPVKQQGEQIALLGAQLGQTGTLVLLGLGALIVYKAVK
jgi:hypothetical protein